MTGLFWEEPTSRRSWPKGTKEALVENYAGKPTTPLNLAAALNIKPTSRGFQDICGSAIAYALTSGGSNAKEIAVAPLGRRILAPLAEGDDLSAKREAALKPRVLGEFMRKYDGSALPRRDIALNVLHEMGVSQERTESVYTMILDTAQSVGFIKEIKDTHYMQLDGTGTATVLERVSEEIEAVDGEAIAEGSPVPETPNAPLAGTQGKELGQGIFIAHGKNKKPLEQLKHILDEFKIPYKIAVEEPNLGRPIGAKVKEIMQSCNCAILIFTADEEFVDKEGKPIWRPSENVVYELGAAGYLYDNRIVILKENGVDFPSNFRDLGYIPFTEDQLNAKSIEVLKELIGFGIVKVST